MVNNFGGHETTAGVLHWNGCKDENRCCAIGCGNVLGAPGDDWQVRLCKDCLAELRRQLRADEVET